MPYKPKFSNIDDFKDEVLELLSASDKINKSFFDKVAAYIDDVIYSVVKEYFTTTIATWIIADKGEIFVESYADAVDTMPDALLDIAYKRFSLSHLLAEVLEDHALNGLETSADCAQLADLLEKYAQLARERQEIFLVAER